MVDKDIEKYAFMTDIRMRSVAKFLEGLEELDNKDTMYLTGKLEVHDSDGFRIGFVASYEDWWVFIPDYAEHE